MTDNAALDPATADTLRTAVFAARTGDLGRARQLAESGLSNGGDVVALNAFLGMVCARAGDPDRAIAHLRKAHEGRPQDITIACNLIAALIDAGSLEDAIAVATPGLAMADASHRVGRYRGFLAQSLGRFADAVHAYEQVVAAVPADFESWNNLGNARRATGDLDGSVAALLRANELDSSAPLRLNLASALIAAGRADEAERVLKRTGIDFPDDAKALTELYVLLKQQGRDDEALQVIGQAIGRDPDDAGLQLKYAIELGQFMRAEEAERAYRRAIAGDPRLNDAYLGLAINYEHTNREEEFAALAELARANEVDAGIISFIEALALRRAGQWQAALDSLDRVPTDIEPERSAHIRGTLLDRLGRSDDAFAAFSKAARLHASHPSEPVNRARQLRDNLRREMDALTPEWRAGWGAAAPAASRPAPVFLVGFPRSGTTLLDTMLMGHPETQVMEEQPPLTSVNTEIGGFDAIAGMDAGAIVAARARYFELAGAHVDLERGGLIVDKSPLHMNKVPLIHRLFPDARFILALRHPCDVVLSCFMSNFRLNAAMSNFLRLEDTAEFYDLNFAHWERARSLLPISAYTVVYEEMIEDREAVLRPLFDFLGLDWRAEVLDHQRTAAARGLITTASYSQVREPIYKRAAGRWLRYRDHLAPVLPTLRPWIDKFGYAL